MDVASLRHSVNASDEVSAPGGAPETSEETAKSLSPTNRKEYRREVIICLLLHFGLVVVHGVLFVVYAYHWEHGFSMDISSSSTTWFPLLVTTILQTVGTVRLALCSSMLPVLILYLRGVQLYIAVLVLLTQRLALRSDLLTRQTLTSIHDKSGAWLGLGSAVMAVWQQTKLRTGAWGISAITVYLLSVFALHITIPGLLHVVPYNATVAASYPTRLMDTNFTGE